MVKEEHQDRQVQKETIESTIEHYGWREQIKHKMNETQQVVLFLFYCISTRNSTAKYQAFLNSSKHSRRPPIKVEVWGDESLAATWF